MDETRFWAMIETAWKAVGGKVKVREKLAAGKLSEDAAYELQELTDDVVEALRGQLNALSAADLLAFDRILECKLYDIDRADVQAQTDGSDDGFLYARGFIVVVGRAFYDAVKADPSRALPDLECEVMCYVSWHLHLEKFGDVPPSNISRESGRNEAGWADA